MEYNLKNHTDELSQIAISMAQIIHADIEIADETLFRIVGTGRMRKRSNRHMGDRGHACKQVLKTGHPEIILNPKEAQICQTCKRKDLCKETLEIIYPIKIKSDIIGTIGFVAYTQQQKNRIEKNLDDYLKFLSNMSNYIALKILNSKKNDDQLLFIKILETIFNQISLGVLILNQDNSISKANIPARNLLKISANYESDPDNQVTVSNTKQTNEILLNFKTNTFLLHGKIYKTDYEAYGTILFFSDSKIIDIKEDARGKKKTVIGVSRITGNSPAIKKVKQDIQALSYSKINVFIQSELGLNVDEIAYSIYEESTYYSKRFLEIDFLTMTHEEIGRVFFEKVSVLAKSAGCTLFLKNIDYLPYEYQNKLYALISNAQFHTINANKKVRIISSSCVDLKEMVRNSLFSPELFYLLTPYVIKNPPLRECKEDLPILAKKYIEKNLSKVFQPKLHFTEDFSYCLKKYPWTGNLAEFLNVMENIALRIPENGIVSAKLLPPQFHVESEEIRPLTEEERIERDHIKNALSLHYRDAKVKKLLAEELGISIATLYRKIKKYGL